MDRSGKKIETLRAAPWPPGPLAPWPPGPLAPWLRAPSGLAAGGVPAELRAGRKGAWEHLPMVRILQAVGGARDGWPGEQGALTAPDTHRRLCRMWCPIAETMSHVETR